MRQTSEVLGVYLSVPFCRAKCSFCNFASGVGTAAAVEGYVELLCGEIRGLRAAAAQAMDLAVPETVNTVYLGGGTPSLLQGGQMERIFAALRGEFRVSKGAEITLEAAPGQIEEPLLETALRLGVNRVSLGVQSFVDREAQAVGRSHTEASCRAEFARLRRAGVRNLGADLIAGLPLQTEASWAGSLDAAAGAGLDHLSVYMLEIDDASRLGREVLGGGARLHAPAVPAEEAVATMYEVACEWLPKAGFAQYEISNFAAGGRMSCHNLKYWLREPYVGFGLDAHSMLEGADGAAYRWANAEKLAEYQGVPATGTAAAVARREAFEETVFLGLRIVSGLPQERLADFPAAWRQEFAEAASGLAGEGLMRSVAGSWQLTRQGRLVSSEIFGELLAGVNV